ncbi:putative oxoglutarate/iron-dependent dioxygenase, non-hem dioxygenase domain-containing protein [Lupinus albus]|uniref:Putative oxoglutarate/iron-dependent dioxygenase, non-hem dioxygenase domain-containing protein n=1 Tax=Lupinus albus TaxID=3870 RepID=A0A6A4N4D2_LUPAL|nr:putative oxoglutarate/iron-dependent dioxygenase, non-hem dioxygenase domain-containing protein [Lupinus albus]
MNNMGSQSQSPLHVVDFTNENMKPGTDAWFSACNIVRTALEDHGCFIARYNRVSKELCDSVVCAMEQLFALPSETKVRKTSDKLFRGYLGQVTWLPLYESLGVDNPLSIDGCQKFAHIMWPQEGNDHFCESVNDYAKVLGELDHMAKRMVFESYGVDMKKCDSFIASSNYLLRCMQYRTVKMDENELGMHCHTDLSTISIVHQLNNLNGLEIKIMEGEWCGVDASPNLFVVMAGDALQVWSNRRIRACEHRVIMNAKKIRYSMGLFSFIDNMVHIPEELVNEQHPLCYKQVFNHDDYIRFYDIQKIKEHNSRIEAYCGI